MKLKAWEAVSSEGYRRLVFAPTRGKVRRFVMVGTVPGRFPTDCKVFRFASWVNWRVIRAPLWDAYAERLHTPYGGIVFSDSRLQRAGLPNFYTFRGWRMHNASVMSRRVSKTCHIYVYPNKLTGWYNVALRLIGVPEQSVSGIFTQMRPTHHKAIQQGEDIYRGLTV